VLYCARFRRISAPANSGFDVRFVTGAKRQSRNKNNNNQSR
jgi:hypothetical protein